MRCHSVACGTAILMQPIEQQHRAMEPLTIIVTLASGIVLGYWGHTLNSKLARDAREHADQIARRERLDNYEAFLLGRH